MNTNLLQRRKVLCRVRCKFEELKPGTCPSADSPQWATACVQSCAKDNHCEGTKKCCRLGCGAACGEPVDLLTIPGLPAVPIMGDIKEKRRSTIVRWSDGVGDTARSVPGRTLYLLQEQHMLGPKYEEARLGEWNLVLRSNKTKVSLHNLLQPGRWYRFRAAAVNAAGTRGYGAPSAVFTPRKGPRPPSAPRRLRVKPIPTNNEYHTTHVMRRFNVPPLFLLLPCVPTFDRCDTFLPNSTAAEFRGGRDAGNEQATARNIVVQARDGTLSRISDTHRFYDVLEHPLN
ncbi:Anosmin-1 [Eumeta japonica]|uniref:Anosmin-1 n=1 Tax=Eumeta variegata TaxID=151549 RepID=A0A4C1WRB7_EUMVA|nr:Anosmin-1 [Eumeta japonica]